MIRVVLDTNIIVSALLQPLGPPAEVFLLADDTIASRFAWVSALRTYIALCPGTATGLCNARAARSVERFTPDSVQASTPNNLQSDMTVYLCVSDPSLRK